MKFNDLGQVVHDYDTLFLNSIRESGKNNLALDDHIFMSKKYVNTLDVDEDTNVELQKYFIKHVESLYRATVEPHILNEMIIKQKYSLSSQVEKNMRKLLGVITPALVGLAAYMDTKSIPISVALSAVTFTAIYYGNKNFFDRKSDSLQNIPGTPEYTNKIFYELEDKLIEMNKLTVD
jgi:hypothetical protein